ncbi:signal recognition particle-docking protein FtsY [Nocardia seriolae]|uniref:Signal recognition particle receptor FtsY n=1 Tax=Nocardia seriolae TaxID=37332 RepID=A0ABC8B377_9NOCA|nr:signal recognition particle-docking protein FtsY [Nocardia seriolae]APB00498.1 Signal recognition particle receptor FtsY [Nocardia seriolae]OJF79210.1 signal recognition particle-docking protein FtsY [Nocardia seriolae]PSK33311.1 signal recognition particle-docking protein FtsY [Nocardia seriolae]QOW30489.1 signal recognition particle-docking protein FtsY [Nocardia seriolae]QUN15588.1 signal recognition particle-docking protein FtsY [Nocardia seriolae]
MTTAEVWILIAAIAAVLLVALVAGYALNKRRRISLTPETTETKEVTDRSGGYQASSGFSFSQGSAAEKAKAPATKPKPVPLPPERTDDEGQPHVGDDAAIPRDAAKRTITNVRLPDPVQGPEPAPAQSVTPADSTAAAGSETAADRTTASEESDGATAADADRTAASETSADARKSADAKGAASDRTGSGNAADATAAVADQAESAYAADADQSAAVGKSVAETAAGVRESDADARAAALEAAGQAGEDAADKGAGEVAEQPLSEEAAAEEAAEAAVAAAEVAAGAEAAVAAHAGAPAAAPETSAPAAAPAEIAEIEPTSGRLTRLRGRLSRSQNAVGKSLLGLLGGGDLDEDSWEEIEDTLVMADLGTASTAAIVERLREEMASRSVRTATEARAVLRQVLVEALRPELDRSIRALPHADHPSILLVVGVNGTGKTTTTGKLARVLVADGRRVLLGAADTFRAAAADQLQTWGERVGAETVRGKEGADPAAVAFDAVSAGIERGVDVVLIDTAGRLHTKTGLMDELGKVKRVVEKKAAVDEVILVLDSTVGQNGLMQARVFADVVDITGVALTKLDGTAKGGIVFQVQHELGVPVKLVGLGEGADDLAPFEPGAFVDALLG